MVGSATNRKRGASGTHRSSGEPKRETPSLVPLDVGRPRQSLPFVHSRAPQKTADDLVLSPDVLNTFGGLLEEFRKGDMLRRHGLPVRSRLLFCGPPGCGKSATAEAFAHETGLDLVTVRLDTVFSSYLGETAANIAAIIEAAERQPCVLFFDEFDALARSRTDPSEHSEIRRVVNTLLLLIENFKGRGFIIAATNLESTLDDALWRRFDEVIAFDAPNAIRIRSMLRLKTKVFPANFDIEARADDMSGFSYASIERVVTTAIKHSILARRKRISEGDFDKALSAEHRRLRIQNKLSQQG